MFACSHDGRVKFKINHPLYKAYTYEVCEACLLSHVLCEGCGELHKQEELVEVSKDKWRCITCAGDVEECERCGNLHYGSLSDSPLGRICSDCFATTIFTCADCGELGIYQQPTDISQPVTASESPIEWAAPSFLNAVTGRMQEILPPSQPCRPGKTNRLWATRYQVKNQRRCSDCITKIETTKTPIEVGTCPVCGEIISNKKHGIFVCEKHVEYIKCCKDCGTYHNQGNMYNFSDSDFVCEECIKTKYSRCKWCRGYHKEDNELNICARCFSMATTCKVCGHIHSGSKKCPVCLLYQPCNRCKNGDGLRVGSSLNSNLSNIPSVAYENYPFLCHKCLTHLGGRFVHQHNFKPPAVKFFGQGPLFMGIEVEFSFPSEKTRRDSITAMGSEFSVREVHAMHDGSVDNGVEFVTAPMSFEYLTTSFQHRAAALFNNHQRSDTAGMHIHLSSAAFGKSHLLRFVNMVHDNDNLVKRVAERLSGRYCNKPDKEYVVAMAESQRGGNHYDQINMSSGQTVELRIFAGVVTVDEMMKNVEFTHALYSFTKESGIDDCTEEKFERYVAMNSGVYPRIHQWLNTHH